MNTHDLCFYGEVGKLSLNLLYNVNFYVFHWIDVPVLYALKLQT